MSKKQAISNIIKDLKSLTQNLESLNDLLEEDNQVENTTSKDSELKEVIQKPEIALEDIRAVLVDKSQNGFNEQVRELIKKYGASKLSEVDKKHYEKLISDARRIGDE